MLAHRLEGRAVRAEAEEENAEVVLGARLAVGARVLRARRLCALGLENHQKVDQNRRLDDARVEALLVVAELDRSLVPVPEVVEVERVVACAAVVAVAVAVARVVGVRELRHRGVRHLANLVYEPEVGLARVGVDAALLRSRRLEDQGFLLVENLDEVLVGVIPCAPTWMWSPVRLLTFALALRIALTTSCRVSMSA